GPTEGQCLWEMHGVWGWCKTKNQAVVLRENYFVKDPDGVFLKRILRPWPLKSEQIDWYTDFYYPLLKRWGELVLPASTRNKVLFVEAIPNEFCPSSWSRERHLPNMVYAPHWYDLYSLFNKSFGEFTVNVQGISRGMFPLKAFYWGHKGARDNFSLQIKTLADEAHKVLGETPVFIGECGIPMDINKGEAFVTEDFIWQKRMMDAMITGLDRALLGFTLWNYNPDNTDEEGDEWNGENFSWFSQRRAMPNFLLEYEQTSPHLDGGGRILDAVVRPYPAKVAGVPLKFDYEMMSGQMSFSWKIPESTDEKGDNTLYAHETEIFFPSLLVSGRKLILEAQADIWTYDEKRQTLFVVPKDNSPGMVHGVRVRVWPPVRPVFNLNDFWSDYGIWAWSLLIVVMSVLAAVVIGAASVVFGYA
ncbi:hypothetical protein AN958_06274, partial [Leucoagaricus sp. SymC.cos]